MHFRAKFSPVSRCIQSTWEPPLESATVQGAAGTFLNAEKSVGGHVKKSITLLFLNKITFYLNV